MEPLDAFKPRELEILQLMAEGQSNREIADRLYIGVETVRWYAKQIYSKLDVPGREEAADKARELGLLALKTGEYPQVQARHTLPAQLTSFIGREREIDEVAALLRVGRLLTLTGPGGTGKTRLSLAVAEGQADAFPDDAYFVDLSPIADPAVVAAAIAQGLGIAEGGDRPIVETLCQSIGRRAILLILDNFEQVIDAAVAIRDLIAGTERLKVLVTSREPLRVSGEQVYPVPPLRLTGGDEAEPPESVALFVQRAQAVKPNFQLDSVSKATVAEICRRLDGMPLAIELAAALSRFLTPDAILARITNRFEDLKGGSRDAPARQRTLRDTIDWSYNLLSPPEKTLFARLSVFRGGRSLDGIEAVCGEGLPADLFDTLAALVDKSMVRQIEDVNGEPRFFMLETIQAYAGQKLKESGTAPEMQQRHAQYVADLVARARPFMRQAEADYWYPRLTLEIDNIRVALAWSLGGGDPELALRMVGSLMEFWFYEGYHVEGQRWAHQALEHLDDVDPGVGAGALLTAAELASGRHEAQLSLELNKQALVLAREAGNIVNEAWALMYIAMCNNDLTDASQQTYESALALCGDGLTIFRKLGDPAGIAQGLNILANIHRVHGHYEDAVAAYEECLQTSLRSGEQRRVMMSHANLAGVAFQMGHYERARRQAYAALHLSWQIGFTYMTVLDLGYTTPAGLLAAGRAESAARVLGASAALRENMNVRHQPNYSMFVESTVEKIRDELGAAAFQAAFDAGRAMSLEEAVTFALDELRR